MVKNKKPGKLSGENPKNSINQEKLGEFHIPGIAEKAKNQANRMVGNCDIW